MLTSTVVTKNQRSDKLLVSVLKYAQKFIVSLIFKDMSDHCQIGRLDMCGH